MTRPRSLGLMAAAIMTAACASDEVAAPEQIVATGPSKAFGLWTPGPNDTCTKEHSSDFGMRLHESWQTSNNIATADGHPLASFDPYFQVNFPSRYYDPSLANIAGRPIDLCFLPVARARGGACQESIRNGAVTGVTFDDPRSAFNGVSRFVDINSMRIANRDGPTAWYTNPQAGVASESRSRARCGRSWPRWTTVGFESWGRGRVRSVLRRRQDPRTQLSPFVILRAARLSS